MSYTKITGLPDGGAVQATDQLVIARNGHTFAIEADEFISASNAASTADIQALQANVANNANTITTLSNAVTGLQGTVANNSSSISTLATNAAAVAATLSILQANVANNANAIDAVAANAALSGPAITALQSNVSALQAGAISARSDIAALQSNVANTANSIGVLTANVTSLQGQIDSVAPKPSGVFAGLYDVSTLQTVQVDTFGRLTSVTSSAYPHKAWRLRIDSTQSSYYGSLSTLEFRTNAGISQKPTGGTAFSTASGDQTTPAMAFDGDSESRWVAQYPVNYPAYIGYVYANAITVAEVLIQASSHSLETPATFAVEYSDDTTTGLDGSWTAAANFTTGTWNGGDQRLFEVAPPTISALNQTVTTLQANVVALSTSLSLNGNAITVLQGNVANNTSTIRALQANIAALQANGVTSNGTVTGSDQTANVIALQSNVANLSATIASSGLVAGKAGVVQSVVYSTGNAAPVFASKPTVGNTLVAFVAYYASTTSFASGWNALSRNAATNDYSQVAYRPVVAGDDVTAANFVTYGTNGGSHVVFEIQGTVVPVQSDLYFVDDATGNVSHQTNAAGNQIVLGFASGGATQVTVAATSGGPITTNSTVSATRSAVGFYSNTSVAITATLTNGNRTLMMLPLTVASSSGLSGLQANLAVLQGNVANLTASYSTLANTVAILQANGVTSNGSNTTATLSNTGVQAGTYSISKVSSVAVDSYGRVTSVSAFNTPHKAWRLRIDHTLQSGDAFCSLAELQFRTIANTAQIATGGTAFSSPTGNGSVPNDGFDNNTGTRWTAAYPNTPFPKYLGYIYASPIAVSEMAITASGFNTETPTQGALEFSDNTTTGLDGTWTQAVTFSTPSTWNGGETRLFQNTGTPLLTDQSANVSVLQANVTSLNGNVSLLQGNVSAVQANVSLHSNAITILQGNVTSLSGSVSILQGNVATLTSQVADLQGNAGAATSVRSAKYWRLRNTGTSPSGTYMAIGELTFATTVGGPQAATGGTPSASSSLGGWPPTRAFDGTVDSGWYSASGSATGAWIAYQFTAPVSIAEVRVDPSTDGAQYMVNQFAIDLSDDGKKWVQVTNLFPDTWAVGTQQAFTVPLVLTRLA